MVLFRLSLNLHNYSDIETKYSQKKSEYILQFYRMLGDLIRITHNNEIKLTRKQFKDYYEPFIKIKKFIFIKPVADDNNPFASIIDRLCPPSLDIDIEFKMSEKHELNAIKQFKKVINTSGNKKLLHKSSFNELRTLYYSTKITHFINMLNRFLMNNNYWEYYITQTNFKTKYIPKIDIADNNVLSLN